jgi:hypothetical protein
MPYHIPTKHTRSENAICATRPPSMTYDRPMADERRPGPVDDPEAARRARQVLRALMTFVSEIALDLDVTWSMARDLFADTLFERAQARHGARSRVAAALDTAKRTVHRYLGPERSDPAAGGPTFNMRRRVLHLLNEGPLNIESIEAALPQGSDVNYAKGAVKSLVADGIVAHRKKTRKYSLEREFTPWYLRAELAGSSRLRRAMQSLAGLMGSRYTPKLEDAAEPAVVMVLYENLPAHLLKQYIDDLYDTFIKFDAKWEKVAEEHRDESPRHFVGGFFSWGRIGAEISEEERRDLLRNDPRAVPYDDSVAPTFHRYQDTDGRYVKLPDDED